MGEVNCCCGEILKCEQIMVCVKGKAGMVNTQRLGKLLLEVEKPEGYHRFIKGKYFKLIMKGAQEAGLRHHPELT